MMPTTLTKLQKGVMADFLPIILYEDKPYKRPWHKSLLLFFPLSIVLVSTIRQELKSVNTFKLNLQNHIEIHLSAMRFSMRHSFVYQNFIRIIDNFTPGTSDILIKF